MPEICRVVGVPAETSVQANASGTGALLLDSFLSKLRMRAVVHEISLSLLVLCNYQSRHSICLLVFSAHQ